MEVETAGAMLQHLLGGCAQSLYLPREFCSLYWCVYGAGAGAGASSAAIPLHLNSVHLSRVQPMSAPCTLCSLSWACSRTLDVKG